MYIATGIFFGVFLIYSLMTAVLIGLEEEASVISVFPVAVQFMGLQKYFIKGMTVGPLDRG